MVPLSRWLPFRLSLHIATLSHCLILCYIRVVSSDSGVAQGGISEEELAAVVGDEKAGSIMTLVDTNRDGESTYALLSKSFHFSE